MSDNVSDLSVKETDVSTNDNISDLSAVEISVGKLKRYKNNPFKPYADDKLAELAKSIEENGLLNPIIVNETEDGETYSVLAGHNRVRAFKKLGRTTIPAFVKNVTEEEAAIIVVETNLQQREKILPSEKAKAYKLRQEAEKRQGKRTDLEDQDSDDETSSPAGTKSDTAKNIGKEAGDSRTGVFRHIRLNELIKPLLDLVDEEKVSVHAGAVLSVIDKDGQNVVYEYFSPREIEGEIKLTVDIAVGLRELSKTGALTQEIIDSYLHEETQNEKQETKQKTTPSKALRLPAKRIANLLDNIPQEERVDYVIEALEYYKKNEKRRLAKKES